MTTVTFFTGASGLVGFSACGHTGYAEAGSDIVCAAVSALSQTAELGVRKVACAQAHTVLDADKALLEVYLTEQDPQAFSRAQLILRTFEEGILEIERSYPAFVRTFYRNGGKHHDESPAFRA